MQKNYEKISVGERKKGAHTMKKKTGKLFLVGREFTAGEIEDIQYIADMFPNLSRTELANTVCENLEWATPTGSLKTSSGMSLLEKLEAMGLVELPDKQKNKSTKSKAIVPGTQTDPGPLLSGSVEAIGPISLELVQEKEEKKLWNEYVDRYHPLGYKKPFGANLRYFILNKENHIGCILFGASAWALADRDRWLGWAERDRAQRLHLIINNNRFLIFPWVQVKNLASKVLSLLAKRIASDWEEIWGYRPVLMETFVDTEEYDGACYKAANWLFLGTTVGRGRMDRKKEYPSSPKYIFIYPLISNFRSYLVGEKTP